MRRSRGPTSPPPPLDVTVRKTRILAAVYNRRYALVEVTLARHVQLRHRGDSNGSEGDDEVPWMRSAAKRSLAEIAKDVEQTTEERQSGW
jgi:hypothetical protein